MVAPVWNRKIKAGSKNAGKGWSVVSYESREGFLMKVVNHLHI